MKNSPATITNSTMNSLMPTSTRLTRSDSLMPTATSTVSTATSRNAARLKWPQPSAVAEGPRLSGQPSPIASRKVTKYLLHPCATTEAPSISSRIRSQPMIQATSSPSVA